MKPPNPWTIPKRASGGAPGIGLLSLGGASTRIGLGGKFGMFPPRLLFSSMPAPMCPGGVGDRGPAGAWLPSYSRLMLLVQGRASVIWRLNKLDFSWVLNFVPLVGSDLNNRKLTWNLAESRTRAKRPLATLYNQTARRGRRPRHSHIKISGIFVFSKNDHIC